MRKLLINIGLIFCITFVHAQDVSKSDIQMPSTPGMNIIGIQNNEISKPGNYAGLYASLISPIISNNGTIPTDLSLEFSPYYLESRNITFNEIHKTALYRDLKISIASTKVIGQDSTTFSRMGIGFKTSLSNGKVTIKSKGSDPTLSMANDVQTVINKITSGLFGDISTADVSALVSHIAERDNDLKQEVKKIISENKSNTSILLGKLEELKVKIEKRIVVDDSRWNSSNRTGHFLELATAFALDFPDNTINYSKINRWGVWLNYTYRPTKELGVVDFGAILRFCNYSFDPKVVFENDALFGDLGGSLNFRVPNTKFSLSGELIHKFGITDLKASDNVNEYTFKGVSENKWNLSIGYQITSNTMWTMSLSEINGNSNYLENNTMQLLMGISATLVSLNK